MMIHARLQKKHIAAPLPVSGFQEDAASNSRPFIAALPDTSGFFSSGWPVAYLIATLIFGIGLLIGSLIPVSEPVQVASRPLMPSRMDTEPKMEVVGRITGLVDCKWADRAQRLPTALTSPWVGNTRWPPGLMEITYDTGAKVIFQGPVTYEMEANGGFLSVGKLTARVESGEWRVESKSPNLQVSKSPNPSLSTLHSPLFTIQTPTALVTDLGTEFGVEVDRHGGTMSHVYCGSVTLQMTSDNGRTEGNAQVLRENESARVENRGKRVIVLGPSAKPADFVRQISKRTVKNFDLVDVVAGGDGFSGKRERGIDGSTGRIVERMRPASGPGPVSLRGHGEYHHLWGCHLSTACLFPAARKEETKVDSAGHVFEAFHYPEVVSSDISCQHIWAGGAMRDNRAGCRTTFGGVDYASPGHGLLFLHANNGITFDLDAIRCSAKGRLLNFCATTANVGLARTLVPTFGCCSRAVLVSTAGD